MSEQELSPAERFAKAKKSKSYPSVDNFVKLLKFPMDEFQEQACRALAEGNGVLVAAPTGAGKTTLISILAGLSKATEGRAMVHGKDVQLDYAQTRRMLGVVPQELVFDPFFTVREALRFQSGYFGVQKNDAWIDELLDSLGLSDKANSS